VIGGESFPAAMGLNHVERLLFTRQRRALVVADVVSKLACAAAHTVGDALALIARYSSSSSSNDATLCCCCCCCWRREIVPSAATASAAVYRSLRRRRRRYTYNAPS